MTTTFDPPSQPAAALPAEPRHTEPHRTEPRRAEPRRAEPRRVAPATSTTGTLPPLPQHDLPVLEAFRGIAALMVVVTHVGFTSTAGTNGSWAGWLSRLDFGVALFFLLSGFLLFRPFVQAAYGNRPRIDVRAYIRRRYIRIYPALILVMVAVFLLLPEARKQPISLWAQTFFLVQNYPSDVVNQLPGLVQTWSLVVEVSFYLLLPVLAVMILGRGTSLAAATERWQRQQEPERPAAAPATRRAARAAERPSTAQRVLGSGVDTVRWAAARPAIAFGVMIGVALVWRIGYSISSDGYARQLLWLPAFLDWFAAGMALAWLRERPQPLPRWLQILANVPGVCWCLSLAGYWLITSQIGGPYGLTIATTGANITKHVTYLIVATLLLVPAVFGDRRAAWRRPATHPIMTWLGRISFGVFLWHPLLIDVIRRVMRMPVMGGGFWLTLSLTLITSLIAGNLSWKYLEEPLQRRWRNGFGARVRRPSAAPAASPAVPEPAAPGR